MSALTPQDVVEKALAASTADGQVAFVVESSEANLRWAGNSLTTNGSMRSRQVVVVSFVDGGAGLATGTVARTGMPDIDELVAASERAARDAGPAEDAVPLISEAPEGAGDWDAEAAQTSIGTPTAESSSAIDTPVRSTPAAHPITAGRPSESSSVRTIVARTWPRVSNAPL